MTETEIILEAACKPPRTRRKPLYTEEEISSLMAVREVFRCVQKGESAIVVTEKRKTFEEVFDTRSSVMALFRKRGLITLKTIDEVSAEDLDKNIFEIKC